MGVKSMLGRLKKELQRWEWHGENFRVACATSFGLHLCCKSQAVDADCPKGSPHTYRMCVKWWQTFALILHLDEANQWLNQENKDHMSWGRGDEVLLTCTIINNDHDREIYKIKGASEQKPQLSISHHIGNSIA